MNDDVLIDLLDEVVGEPPNTITPDAIRHLGRARRRTKRVVVGIATALTILAAIALPYAIVNADRSAPADPAGIGRSICATAPPETAAKPVPAGVIVTTVIRCDTSVVKRPGDGLWLRASEQRATVAATAYGTAIKPPAGGLKCAKGVHRTTMVGGDVVPDLVADAAGHVYRAEIVVCDTDVTAVEAAAKALVWHTVASHWTVMMLSEANASSTCGVWWATNPNGLGNRLTAQPTLYSPPLPWSRNVIEADRQATDVLCINRMSRPTGPTPDDLIQANRLTGSRKEAVLQAMSRMPGAVSRSAPATGQTHQKPGQACSTPSKNLWSVSADGTLIGYVGFDTCARALAPDLRSVSPDLLLVAEELGGPGI